jgi:hypothetical protein
MKKIERTGGEVYDLVEGDEKLFQFRYRKISNLWRRVEWNIFPQTYILAEAS